MTARDLEQGTAIRSMLCHINMADLLLQLCRHDLDLGAPRSANQSSDLIVKVDFYSWSAPTSYRSTSSRPVVKSAYMNVSCY